MESIASSEKQIVNEIIKEALMIFHVGNGNYSTGRDYELVKKIVKRTISETLKRIFVEVEENIKDCLEEVKTQNKQVFYMRVLRRMESLKEKLMGE